MWKTLTEGHIKFFSSYFRRGFEAVTPRLNTILLCPIPPRLAVVRLAKTMWHLNDSISRRPQSPQTDVLVREEELLAAK